MNIVDIHMVFFQVLFVSERMVIGVGFDCNPMVFAADDRGIWYIKSFKNYPCVCYSSRRSVVSEVENGPYPSFPTPPPPPPHPPP
jgi:hypothetical protein